MGKMKNIQIIIEELQEQGIQTNIEQLIEIHTNQNIPIEKLEQYLIENKKANITM